MLRAGRLGNRVAIVTGASSGIGRAIALAYAREGAKVMIADREETSIASLDAGLTTASAIMAHRGQAVFHQTDVCASESVEAMVTHAVAEFGRIDILVNAAGVAPEALNPQPIWSMPESTWDATIGVNLKGTLNVSRAGMGHMLRQSPLPNGDRGWVVNISSIYGQTAAANNGAYCASKHGVLGMTKSAALDGAPYKIRVNAICPGFTWTPMTSLLLTKDDSYRRQVEAVQPLKGIGDAADVAKVAVMLASDDASWMTGTAVAVDGGFLSQ